MLGAMISWMSARGNSDVKGWNTISIETNNGDEEGKKQEITTIQLAYPSNLPHLDSSSNTRYKKIIYEGKLTIRDPMMPYWSHSVPESNAHTNALVNSCDHCSPPTSRLSGCAEQL